MITKQDILTVIETYRKVEGPIDSTEIVINKIYNEVKCEIPVLHKNKEDSIAQFFNNFANLLQNMGYWRLHNECRFNVCTQWFLCWGDDEEINEGHINQLLAHFTDKIDFIENGKHKIMTKKMLQVFLNSEFYEKILPAKYKTLKRR